LSNNAQVLNDSLCIGPDRGKRPYVLQQEQANGHCHENNGKATYDKFVPAHLTQMYFRAFVTNNLL
jgi:hypothetical protein